MTRHEAVSIAVTPTRNARQGRGFRKAASSPTRKFTRDLVNEPSNKLTPRILAQKAEAMAKEAGLSVEILDEKKIADLKMGALLSVARAARAAAHDRRHLQSPNAKPEHRSSASSASRHV